MELREWLIILGLVLVTIIVIDGVRRLQRQRKVPRLDEVHRDEGETNNVETADPEEAARQEEINWELPNGGARVVRPAANATVVPKPKLQRQEHPGPSKVFSRMAQEQEQDKATEPTQHRRSDADVQRPEPVRAERQWSDDASLARESRPSGQRKAATQPADTEHEEESARRSSRSGMAAAFRSGSQRVSQSMQRMSSAFQRHDETEHSTHREPSLGASQEETVAMTEPSLGERRQAPEFEPPFEPVRTELAEARHDEFAEDEAYVAYQDSPNDDVVTPHPMVEKARRHNVSAQRARETLAHSDEIIVISVLARNEEGFSGTDLLNLMLACGLRYSEMGIFLRYETENADSELQFAMVDVVKPGVFDLEAMDDFSTPGVTFLMPLPGAQDSAAAFEAMFETAMVLVRNLGGELKDENRSVMTAQTVEFARQRVQEFERRNRLHRYQVN